MNKELFSMEEFARLKNFANYAVEEDRRLHNIGNNNNYNKNAPIYQQKEEKKFQQQIKKPEPPKPVIAKPPPIKKVEPQKPKPPPIKKEEKKEPPKPPKKIESQQPIQLTGFPPKQVYMSPKPSPSPMAAPKEEVIKIPENAKFHYGYNEPYKDNNFNKKEEPIKHTVVNKVETTKKPEPPKPPKIEPPKKLNLQSHQK